ncbi:MAG TPA: cation:proton antiporter [Nitrospira sp.]|nr:cation:proton antiporter [Nitrospira sp.]
MPLLTSLLVLIVAARLFGGLFARLKQPAIVGEIVAGILLGPAVLGLVHSTPPLQGISDLAMFLVVSSAGLEMNSRDVLKAIRGKGLVIAILGFFIPFLAGLGLGAAFSLDLMRTIFLGLCISITALPVALRIMESFKMLDTDIARYCIVAAIANDIVALLILGVILGLPSEGGTLTAIAWAVLVTGGKLVAFGAMVWGAGALLAFLDRKGIAVSRILERLVSLFGSDALFGIVIMLVLFFASVSEMLGFSFVIGAFFGALLIDKELFLASRYSELELTMSSLSKGFLAPLFFASLGLEFSLTQMPSVQFVTAVLLVSIFTKIFAGWLGGVLTRLSQAEAWGIGFLLNGRGIMELVIANIAYTHHFIGQGFFSTLVVMGVVTTILAPLLFKKFVYAKLAGTTVLRPSPSAAAGE